MGPSTTILIGSFRKDNSNVRHLIGENENEKESKTELLQSDSNSSNNLASNLGDLLEQIERRCEESAGSWYSNGKSSSSSRIGCLKKELRHSARVAWHLYDVDDLWAALKNYLRHLPSCPLGSLYYSDWSQMQWQYTDDQRNESIKCLLEQLEPSEYHFLKSLFRILYRISRCHSSSSSSSNCSSSSSHSLESNGSVGSLELAARLGPYLLWEKAPRHSTKVKVSLQTVWLISYMIDSYNVVF
ncbi:hypothetical protein CHUAL_008544 [Chamberlinius hualienensis]